jgi:hypothetical protein
MVFELKFQDKTLIRFVYREKFFLSGNESENWHFQGGKYYKSPGCLVILVYNFVLPFPDIL